MVVNFSMRYNCRVKRGAVGPSAFRISLRSCIPVLLMAPVSGAATIYVARKSRVPVISTIQGDWESCDVTMYVIAAASVDANRVLADEEGLILFFYDWC